MNLERVPRGWLLLGAGVLSWVILIAIVIGAAAGISAAMQAVAMLFGGEA